jgi:ferredoxin
VTAPAAVRVVVDTRLCASTGMCESVAPDVFEIGDDGALVVHHELVPAELVDAAREAARCCPTRALSVG